MQSDEFFKYTEQDSQFTNLEQMDTLSLLQSMNRLDREVAIAVNKCIPQIHLLVDEIVRRLSSGGRLFYLGAGTSGRLGIVDASECPPTFGVAYGLVIGLIAGGDSAIRKAVEFAEDDTEQAWKDLSQHHCNVQDVVIGIAASGTTPYVVAGLKTCQSNNIFTACITNNPSSPLTQFADIKIECIVGPEFISGSTRLKSGTSQKLILNMISTCTMIKLGKVSGNKMIDMQLNNHKLVERAVKIICDQSSLTKEEAQKMLLQLGSVRSVLDEIQKK